MQNTGHKRSALYRRQLSTLVRITVIKLSFRIRRKTRTEIRVPSRISLFSLSRTSAVSPIPPTFVYIPPVLRSVKHFIS
jgi:hypothetical protein